MLTVPNTFQNISEITLNRLNLLNGKATITVGDRQYHIDVTDPDSTKRLQDDVSTSTLIGEDLSRWFNSDNIGSGDFRTNTKKISERLALLTGEYYLRQQRIYDISCADNEILNLTSKLTSIPIDDQLGIVAGQRNSLQDELQRHQNQLKQLKANTSSDQFDSSLKQVTDALQIVKQKIANLAKINNSLIELARQESDLAKSASNDKFTVLGIFPQLDLIKDKEKIDSLNDHTRDSVIKYQSAAKARGDQLAKEIDELKQAALRMVADEPGAEFDSQFSAFTNSLQTSTTKISDFIKLKEAHQKSIKELVVTLIYCDGQTPVLRYILFRLTHFTNLLVDKLKEGTFDEAHSNFLTEQFDVAKWLSFQSSNFATSLNEHSKKPNLDKCAELLTVPKGYEIYLATKAEALCTALGDTKSSLTTIKEEMENLAEIKIPLDRQIQTHKKIVDFLKNGDGVAGLFQTQKNHLIEIRDHLGFKGTVLDSDKLCRQAEIYLLIGEIHVFLNNEIESKFFGIRSYYPEKLQGMINSLRKFKNIPINDTDIDFYKKKANSYMEEIRQFNRTADGLIEGYEMIPEGQTLENWAQMERQIATYNSIRNMYDDISDWMDAVPEVDDQANFRIQELARIEHILGSTELVKNSSALCHQADQHIAAIRFGIGITTFLNETVEGSRGNHWISDNHYDAEHQSRINSLIELEHQCFSSINFFVEDFNQLDAKSHMDTIRIWNETHSLDWLQGPHETIPSDMTYRKYQDKVGHEKMTTLRKDLAGTLKAVQTAQVNLEKRGVKLEKTKEATEKLEEVSKDFQQAAVVLKNNQTFWGQILNWWGDVTNWFGEVWDDFVRYVESLFEGEPEPTVDTGSAPKSEKTNPFE